MKILAGYLSKTVFVAAFLVLMLLASLALLIGFMGELDAIGSGDYTITMAIKYVLLDLPNQIYALFPMSVLVGALLGLGLLASQHELLIMQSSGISKAKVAVIVAQALVVLVVIVTVAGELLAPKLKRWAESTRISAISQGQALTTPTGTWLRDQENFIQIEKILSERYLQNITIYSFDRNQHLTRMVHAQRAIYQHNSWELQQVQQTTFSYLPGHYATSAQQFATLPWPIKLNPRLLRISQIAPEQMNLRQLYAYIHYSEANGLRVSDYQFIFWQRILQPFATLLLIFAVVPFIFGPLRSKTTGFRCVIGILVGFGFYMLNRLFGPAALVYQLPPVLAAALPMLIIAIIALILLRKSN